MRATAVVDVPQESFCEPRYARFNRVLDHHRVSTVKGKISYISFFLRGKDVRGASPHPYAGNKAQGSQAVQSELLLSRHP